MAEGESDGRGSERPASTSGSGAKASAGTSAPPVWLRTATVWVGGVLAIALLALLGVAVLPGWWASFVGSWVDGVQSRGVLLGLVLGVVFTLLPLGLGLLAMRSGLSPRARVALIAGAVLLLLPNVLTIAIALSDSDARSVVAIEAPGLRGATLAGIGVTLLVVAAVLIGRAWARRTRRGITEAQGRAVQRSRDLAAEREKSGTDAEPPDGAAPGPT